VGEGLALNHKAPDPSAPRLARSGARGALKKRGKSQGSPLTRGASGRALGRGARADSDTRRDYPIGGYVQRTSRQTCPAATAQPLRLGAAVRLRGRKATGVVIGNSRDRYRVRVQWDDTGEVTHCLKRNLEPAR
jgi:hypothetical protein